MFPPGSVFICFTEIRMHDSDLTECLVENVDCFAELFTQTVMDDVPFCSEVKFKV